MKQLIVDASICAPWILEDENAELSEKLLASIEQGKTKIIVPSIWTYEMHNILISAFRRKRLDSSGLKIARKFLSLIPIQEIDISSKDVQNSIFQVALENDLSFYDAAYLELAIRTELPLYSLDQKLTMAALANDVSTN